MNPQFDKPASLDLPPPMPEGNGAGQFQVPEAAPAQPEVAVAPHEQPPLAAPAPVLAIPAAPPIQQGQTAVSVAAPTTHAATPAVADDADLIEKEWVNKAKEIITKTADDPYRQSKEMTVVKADYLQKRYNKALKLSE